MRKSLFLLFISVFSVLLNACSDDSSSTSSQANNGTGEKFIGTYNITYFGTVATGNGKDAVSKISTDCTKFDNSDLGKRFPNTVLAQCTEGTRIIGGKITISKEGDNYKVVSKLQLIGPYFISGIGVAGQDDTYQYTDYALVPATDVTDREMNISGNVVGVSGRNLKNKTNNPASPFKLTRDDNGNIFVNMELKDKKVSIGNVNALTNVEARKVSENIESLDPNSLFETQFMDSNEQKVFDKFVQNPK